ncbi:MAG TPA: hypothetical protein ENJ95_24660 [Bacteroidetes bacterium]|nr:hypothetical protein [Bacteroidota bacterium]
MIKVQIEDVIALNEKFIKEGGSSKARRKENEKLAGLIKKALLNDLMEIIEHDAQSEEEFVELAARAIAEMGIKSDKSLLRKVYSKVFRKVAAL